MTKPTGGEKETGKGEGTIINKGNYTTPVGMKAQEAGLFSLPSRWTFSVQVTKNIATKYDQHMPLNTNQVSPLAPLSRAMTGHRSTDWATTSNGNT